MINDWNEEGKLVSLKKLQTNEKYNYDVSYHAKSLGNKKKSKEEHDGNLDNLKF